MKVADRAQLIKGEQMRRSKLHINKSLQTTLIRRIMSEKSKSCLAAYRPVR